MIHPPLSCLLQTARPDPWDNQQLGRNTKEPVMYEIFSSYFEILPGAFCKPSIFTRPIANLLPGVLIPGNFPYRGRCLVLVLCLSDQNFTGQGLVHYSGT